MQGLHHVGMPQTGGSGIRKLMVYIGEPKQPISQRFKKYRNLEYPTRVDNHCLTTGHSVSIKNDKVLTKEQHQQCRKVKKPNNIMKQGQIIPSISKQLSTQATNNGLNAMCDQGL